MKKLTIEEKNYIAGFLDGDGSIFAQIIQGKNYKYNFRIRVSIGFYQHKSKHWFMLKLKKLLKFGVLRIRKDNVSECEKCDFASFSNFVDLRKWRGAIPGFV